MTWKTSPFGLLLLGLVLGMEGMLSIMLRDPLRGIVFLVLLVGIMLVIEPVVPEPSRAPARRN